MLRQAGATIQVTVVMTQGADTLREVVTVTLTDVDDTAPDVTSPNGLVISVSEVTSP